MRYATLLLALACLTMTIGCGDHGHEHPGAETTEAAEQTHAAAAERHDQLYVCGCEPDCECNSVSANPGTCSCGKELRENHVVRVEGTEALLCSCAGGCDCTVDSADGTKCSCGETLRRVSLEGTGLYHCGCGETCDCSFVSETPGQCTCGKDLITAG